MISQLLHNPRCSKSRSALNLLQSQGINPEIRLYLLQPPTRAELIEISCKLGLQDVRGMMRQQDPMFTELGLANQALSQHQLITHLRQHPILLERPIFIYGKHAIIGRPPEQVLQILD